MSQDNFCDHTFHTQNEILQYRQSLVFSNANSIKLYTEDEFALSSTY